MTSTTPSPFPVAERVSDGVWGIPIPLVQSPIGSVMVYAIEHADGFLLVDAGYDDEPCWTALVDGLARAGGSVGDVTGIVLTHNHPDHVGLAQRIREASRGWIAIHLLDALSGTQQSSGTFLEQLDTELRLGGLPEDLRTEMVEAARRLSKHAYDLVADRFLQPGETIADHGIELRILATPGHTRGHICLHDERTGVLYGGDLLLTTGEVQLGLVALPTDDPAGELLASLALVEALPVSLVLPGHGDAYADAAGLARSAAAALRGRLATAEEHVRSHPGLSAWELCEGFDWGRGWERMGTSSRRFAAMQMIAWLRHLASSGRAHCEAGPPERFEIA